MEQKKLRIDGMVWYGMCRAAPDEPVVTTHPILNAIASKHNKTAGQVVRLVTVYNVSRHIVSCSDLSDTD